MKGFYFKGALSALAMIAAGCGVGNQSDSHLDWEQSRENSKRYAYLWEQDLEDTFLFGASVIEVDDFLAGALSAVIRPIQVKLRLDEDNSRLEVVSREGRLMSFDTSVDDGRVEVDFASAGNDLELRGLIDVVGGQATLSNRDGMWISSEVPEVTYIDQDNDTVVVDLLHQVSQVITGTNADGELFVSEVRTRRPGKVKVRVWLRRQSTSATLSSSRTVGEGLAENIGYFSSQFMSLGNGDLPIQRFAIGDAAEGSEVTFYLKDFPSEFIGVGKEAILAWNAAFDGSPIKVAIAGDDMDAGDPRYHVVKWFDDTDGRMGWAGVARAIVDPSNGVVTGGGLYIQGNTLIRNYEGVHRYAVALADNGLEIVGRIGQVDFDFDQGERPVLPFITDPSMAFSEYMQGYYREVISHEVGHVLGLRHNFRGSTQLDDRGYPSSVMDYAPLGEVHRIDHIGAYDLAAIRWGYYGERPNEEFAFCLDQDVNRAWDCNRWDHGDPIAYTLRSIVDAGHSIASSTIPVERTGWLSAIRGTVANANKIWALRGQMSEEDLETVEEKLPVAMGYLYTLEPEGDLTDEQREVVSANIETLNRILSSM